MWCCRDEALAEAAKRFPDYVAIKVRGVTYIDIMHEDRCI